MRVPRNSSLGIANDALSTVAGNGHQIRLAMELNSGLADELERILIFLIDGVTLRFQTGRARS